MAFCLRQYWKLKRTQLATGISMQAKLADLKLKIEHAMATLPDKCVKPPPELLDLSKSADRSKPRQAVSFLRAVCKQAWEQRRIFLSNQEQLAADQDDTKRERILHSIRRAEARRKMFKMFRWATKPVDDSGIHMVRVPKDPTANPRDPTTKEWVDVLPTMESHTLDYLKQHFSMAKSTPFASEPSCPNVAMMASPPLQSKSSRALQICPTFQYQSRV